MTIGSPIIGNAENKFVITVAPQKLICPQGKTYPRKAVAIINSKITTPNIHSNSRVGLLFLSTDGTLFDGSAARLRINGRAEIDDSPEALAGLPGAKRLVRVMVDHIFPNCPRYIPEMTMIEPSVYSPREGHIPPEPRWKSLPHVKDIIDSEKAKDGSEPG